MRVIQLCGLDPSIADAPVIEGAERWMLGAGFNTLGLGEGPWTRAFDVHPYSHILQRRPDAWAWYQRQTRPIYLLAATSEIPASVTYPREALIHRLGPRAGTALSSSLDHMMALALGEGCTTIRLDGVRMLGMREWETERECLAYWIGRAEAMGVEVITDPWAAFCTPEVVYGFGDVTGARRAPGEPLPLEAFAGAA